MPTQTFFNLAEEKKARIVKAAMDEFAENSFKHASIARIIQNAGIPRGSFYQYFTDLKDIYKYIFDLIGEAKMKFMQQGLQGFSEMNTFQTIKEIYKFGILFAKEHPEFAKIGNRFYKEDQTLKQEIMGGIEGRSNDFFENILKAGQARGEVSKSVDVKVAAFIFYSLNLAMAEYIFNKNNHENLLDDVDEFMAMADKMLHIMEFGVKDREGK